LWCGGGWLQLDSTHYGCDSFFAGGTESVGDFMTITIDSGVQTCNNLYGVALK